MDKIPLDLPRTFEHLKSENLESVLVEELYLQRSRLPLNDLVSHGGWPDDDTLEMALDSVQERDGLVELVIHASFDEVCSTGCADIQRRAESGGVLLVYVDAKTGAAHSVER